MLIHHWGKLRVIFLKLFIIRLVWLKTSPSSESIFSLVNCAGLLSSNFLMIKIIGTPYGLFLSSIFNRNVALGVKICGLEHWQTEVNCLQNMRRLLNYKNFMLVICIVGNPFFCEQCEFLLFWRCLSRDYPTQANIASENWKPHQGTHLYAWR